MKLDKMLLVHEGHRGFLTCLGTGGTSGGDLHLLQLKIWPSASRWTFKSIPDLEKTSKRTSKDKDKDNVNGHKQKGKKNVCLLAESWYLDILASATGLCIKVG